ncbi:hydroxycarboxylic acid receptor 2-like [Leucoraja erinacea]|uniref:hydroxycarboxylic acid receptor 2-like n=1 Tax=Leucoraja erinaceus TaxID=7782 RepID=UPI0024553559|nr:hydroxycarboxylic acid receptor 2-like [Leucoraja erinacea]
MARSAQQCVLDETDFSSHTTLVICVTVVLGFVGNAIALWIFLFHVKRWNPNTVYSLNLAIADMLLIICLPVRIGYLLHVKGWVYGDVLCRMDLFMISINRTGSICFLMVIAIDRYLKVIHPLHKVNKISAKCAVKVAAALWIMAVAIWMHLVTERHDSEHNNVTLCESFKINGPLSGTSIWSGIVFIIFFCILPASVILFCTSCITWKLRQIKRNAWRKYKRTVRIVITVAAIFIICFMPTNIAFVAVVVTKLRSARHCHAFKIAIRLFYNTLFLTYMNSMVNPVVHCVFNSSFNNALMKALVRLKLKSGRSGISQETGQEDTMDGLQRIDK